MPTKTTGLKSKIFVILKKRKRKKKLQTCTNLCVHTKIFHQMYWVIIISHAKEAYFWVCFSHRHLFCPWTTKTGTCYNNNKNNHLYIPAALSFHSRLLSFRLFLFFCPHQQNTNITRISYINMLKKRKNQLMISIFQNQKYILPMYQTFHMHTIYILRTIFMLAFVYLCIRVMYVVHKKATATRQ